MTDPIETLREIRPRTAPGELWPKAAREAALERLLATPVVSRKPPKRGRIAVTAAVAFGILVSSAGVAAAAGVLPRSFVDNISFWSTESGGRVTAEDARRVAQGPGPDGTVLSVWSANGGTTCVTAIFEAPGPIDRPAPASFRSAGGQCAEPGQGDGMGGSSDERGIHTMWASAGAAVTAQVLSNDGSSRAAIRAEGMFFFWYSQGEAPSLVTFDAGGRELQRRSLPLLGR